MDVISTIQVQFVCQGHNDSSVELGGVGGYGISSGKIRQH